MKPSNEEKARFFAQYYTDSAIVSRPGFNNRDNQRPVHVDEFDTLELKPLSSISDEDAIELEKLISQSPEWWQSVGDKFLSEEGKKHATQISKAYNPVCLQLGASIKIIDYLRSKSYALPFNGHSVEQMIEWGWIKLKKK